MLKHLYRVAIRLMPAEYRAVYGEEQWRLFEQVLVEERPATAVSRLAWSLDLLTRAVWAAVQVRSDRRRSGQRSSTRASMGMGGSMKSDLRFTFRSVRTSPWYAAAVVGVVAVTLVLATTTFAVVDGVLFRPLPYPDAGSLVTIEPDFASVPRPATRGLEISTYSASIPDVLNWRAAVPEVPMTGFRAQPWSGLGTGINQSSAGVALVQANFFDVIGVAPLFGGFTGEDFKADQVVDPVIITYDAWMARYNGARDVLGRQIITDRVRGAGVRVVGVMPKGFTFPSTRTDVTFLAPLVTDPKVHLDPRVRAVSEVLARLPASMTRATLTERLAPGVAATAAAFPPLGQKPQGWSDNGWRRQGPYDAVNVTPLAQSIGRSTRPFFLAVFAAVAMLVLIAAANVSSLMTARALERRREIEVRQALGAGRWAVARLWIVEAATLIAAGGIAGLALAPSLLGVMTRLLPAEIVLLKPAQLDLRVAGFVLLVLVVLVMLVVMAPIRRSLSLAGTQLRGASERVRTPGRLIVIGSQVGLAFVLTVVGACLVGSLLIVYSKDRPIQVAGVVSLDVFMQGPGATMDVSPERTAREERLRERLSRIPDVSAVGATAAQVLKGGGAMTWFLAPAGTRHPENIDTWAVTPGFYDVLQPEVVTGRVPNYDELRTHAPLIVVSERAAQAYWPGRSAVGGTLTDQQTKEPFTVIGVVKDVRWTAWDTVSPVIYAPYATVSRAPWLSYFLRTQGNTGRVADAAVQAIEETDRFVRTTRVETLDAMFKESVSLRRFQSWLFGGFAAASLVVVGVGVFGLLAMSTARRTREVGIRCALGATPTSVARLIVREQAAAVIGGLILGGATAAWAVRFVKGYLYELTVADPRIWGSAIGLILLTALIGTLVPALRASRIDPLKALRTD
jgi:predicted permease